MSRFHFRFAALAAATTIAVALAGCDPEAATTAAHYVASSTRFSVDASAAPRTLARQRMALDALLTNLLDDAEPPRFADIAQPLVCGDGSTVLVNGKPLAVGAELPASSFTLDFQLSGACPLGIAGPRLSGPVQMVVVRDDDAGLVPVVLEQHGL